MRSIKPLGSCFAALAVLAALAFPADSASAATTTIVAQHSGKCLDVIGGNSGTGNGVLLEQWTCVSGAANQAFTLKDMGNARYQIIASHSNKCVGTVNGGTANGTRIEQLDCVGAPKQLWSIVNNGAPGQFRIVAASGGRCLDVTGGTGATGDGVLMELWDCVSGAGNQSWALTPPAPSCARSPVIPAIASQAAWDAKYNAQYGTTLPNVSGGAEDFAWQGHYWVRAYVSMAKTYGDTKHLNTAVRMIDYWLAHTDSAQGWGSRPGTSQMSLDTGVISSAIALFAYEVWKDPRFTAYRPKANSYIASIEPLLRSYDRQWVENAPYPGSPSFYVYSSCGSNRASLCSAASLMMYNQGVALTKALLLVDRVKRLQGQTPDAGYLHKADAAAAYFKTFARLSGSAYNWDYGGARGSGMEDVSHAHLDLSHLLWAKKFNLGGLTDTDMSRLVGTMQRVLSGAGGGNVSQRVDGSGTSADNWLRVSIGYDWIDLADYDRTLLDKTITVFNRHMPSPSSARFYLGWAEILRKNNCVSLY